MRGASLADVHLGFRSGTSVTDGRNTREVDVEKAFLAAVEQISEAEVDVITIAGDLVHHPRVSTHALMGMLEGMGALCSAAKHVFVVQGNHDAGRTPDTASPLHLLPAALDSIKSTEDRLATQPYTGYRYGPGEDTAVTLLPFTVGVLEEYRILGPIPDDPDPWHDLPHDRRLMVVHAPLAGAGLSFHYAGGNALQLDALLDRYHVVAAGDFHEYRDLAPERDDRIAFYSGSLERTSTNFWGETLPKGWVLWDTQDMSQELVSVPTRPMVDLACAGGPEKVNDALREMSTKCAGTLARLVATDFPRGRRGEIDAKLERECRMKATTWRFDLRYAVGGERVSLSEKASAQQSVIEAAHEFFDRDDPPDNRCLYRLGHALGEQTR